MSKKEIYGIISKGNKIEINAQISEQTAQMSKKDTNEDFRN